MSYFDKWKVKSSESIEKTIEHNTTKKVSSAKPSKITDFISKNNIKEIEIDDTPPPVIDYSGPITIEKIQPKIIPQHSTEIFQFTNNCQKSIHVYTDGSCINNGKKNAKAGIGIFFKENDPRNISRIVEGKQTNNVAELTAIIVALDILKNEIEEGKRVVVYTDSEYAIKCFTTYGRRLQSVGFITKETVPNLDLIKIGLSKVKNNVSFQHIRSHTGKKDEHSLGNEQADLLANKAIGIESKPEKIYLRVSYCDKDKAKELGAKWDSKTKMWFVHNEGHPAHKLFGTF